MQNSCSKELLMLSTISRDLQASRSGACRLAKYGDSVRVAAESSDVTVDPLQRHALIKQAEIESIVGDGGCSSYSLLSACIQGGAFDRRKILNT